MTTKPAEHTPTPWVLGHEMQCAFQIVRSLNDRDLFPIAEAIYTNNYHHENRDVAKANAAFIVRAVNQHAALQAENAELREALEESVKLQSHYAGLLNSYDAGERLTFADADQWMERLQALARPPEVK